MEFVQVSCCNIGEQSIDKTISMPLNSLPILFLYICLLANLVLNTSTFIVILNFIQSPFLEFKKNRHWYQSPYEASFVLRIVLVAAITIAKAESLHIGRSNRINAFLTSRSTYLSIIHSFLFPPLLLCIRNTVGRTLAISLDNFF